jgi:hypothetical protein
VLEEFGNVIARGGAAVVIGSQSGHRLGALTPEQNKALATVPGDDLLKLPMLQCDRVTDTLYAYQLAKRGNALRVMAEAERWAKRGARVNTISPGIITPLAADELTGPRGEAYRSMLVQSPAGRAGTPRRGRDTRGAAHGLGRRVHHRERLPRELGKRLEAVERDRWRKPHRETFAEFADRFEADYLPGRNLKPATVTDYRLTLRRHLVPFLGHFELAAVDAADVDAYIAAKAGSLSPKTIANHVGLLRVMLKVARRWRLVTADPAEDVDLPRTRRRR